MRHAQELSIQSLVTSSCKILVQSLKSKKVNFKPWNRHAEDPDSRQTSEVYLMQ